MGNACDHFFSVVETDLKNENTIGIEKCEYCGYMTGVFYCDCEDVPCDCQPLFDDIMDEQEGLND